MAISWHYFKSYSIEKDDTYHDVIRYQNGGQFDLTYSHSGKMLSLLNHFSVYIPSYDEFNPPASQQLDLIPPVVVKYACHRPQG